MNERTYRDHAAQENSFKDAGNACQENLQGESFDQLNQIDEELQNLQKQVSALRLQLLNVLVPNDEDAKHEVALRAPEYFPRTEVGKRLHFIRDFTRDVKSQIIDLCERVSI